MSKPSIARIYRGTARNLAALARRLRAGELVAVPTETVYGLAANAFDARACRKIFAAKGRPTSDPLIVHLPSACDLDRVAITNPAAWRLARKFWPGPLTLVLPKKPIVPDIVSAGLPSVAVRVPGHPLFRRLLKLAAVPLAAPSANAFGYISPTTADHVRHGLGKKIRHILDGGPAHIGLESTIIDLRNPARPRLLRPGAITQAQLEKALGRKVAIIRQSVHRGKTPSAQIAPGLLVRHYSPRTPVELHREFPAQRPAAAHVAWVSLAKPAGPRAKKRFLVRRRRRPARHRPTPVRHAPATRRRPVQKNPRRTRTRRRLGGCHQRPTAPRRGALTVPPGSPTDGCILKSWERACSRPPTR